MSIFEKVTFGKFKKFTKEEDLIEDKNRFINSKKLLLSYLLYKETEFDKLTEEQICDLDNLIKRELQEFNSIDIEDNDIVYYAFNFFLFQFGLSIELISDQEEKELLTMDLSYENCQKMFLNIFDKYIEEMNKIWPDEIKVCYKERGFVSYCHCRAKARIKNDNSFLKLIRDYFLLDKGKFYYDDSRDNNLFNEIKIEMENIYPELKEKYGMNKYLDKILGFLGYRPSDYSYDEVSKLLNNYDKQKKQKNKGDYITIKQKED